MIEIEKGPAHEHEEEVASRKQEILKLCQELVKEGRFIVSDSGSDDFIPLAVRGLFDPNLKDEYMVGFRIDVRGSKLFGGGKATVKIYLPEYQEYLKDERKIVIEDVLEMGESQYSKISPPFIQDYENILGLLNRAYHGYKKLEKK